MNTKKRLNVALFLIVALFASSAARAAGYGFLYTGRLVTSEDTVVSPATNGTRAIFVRLYGNVLDAKSAALWGREMAITTRDGYFAVELTDAGTPLPGTAHATLQDAIAALPSSTLLIGITPIRDTNDEITPRQALVSVPFAVRALDVTTAQNGLTVTGPTTAGTVRVDGSLTVSGPAMHHGAVTFDTAPKLTSLDLAASQPLAVERMAITDPIALSRAEAGSVNSTNITSLAGTVISGSATFENVRAPSSATVTKVSGVNGTLETGAFPLQAKTLTVKNLTVTGNYKLLDFSSAITELSPSDESTTYSYKKGDNGYWINTGDDCVLTFGLYMPIRRGDAGSKILFHLPGLADGEGPFYRIQLTEEDGEARVPFQCFLRKNDKLSWSASSVTLEFLKYRTFTY